MHRQAAALSICAVRQRAAAILICAMAQGIAGPALAQASYGPTLSFEAISDERRRGIGWSDGKPTLRTTLSVPVTSNITIDATAVGLRESARHGGADAVIDLRAGFDRTVGGWRLSTDATYHAFLGASGQGYAELGASAGFLLGPASADIFLRYAPDQRSIGGDNIYVGSALSMAIPGTPLTASAHIGRSSGKVDDALRAARLRPDGRYWDHGAALDYHRGRWSAGLRYADSTVGAGGTHSGATVIGHIGVRF